MRFKQSLFTWQRTLAEDGWNSLFLSNHDLPRAVSRYGDDGAWRVRSAKMLATVAYLMRGTPFIYQGEEIGMTNAAFERLDQFRDVEVLGNVAAWTAAGKTVAQILASARAVSRDNARTPVQWSDAPHAGFTSGAPWIETNGNHREINVAADAADPDGVMAHYRRLIALRRDLDIVSHGQFVAHAEDHPAVVAYCRETADKRLSVVANFTSDEVVFAVPEGMTVSGTSALHTVGPWDSLAGTITLAPYESFAVLGKRPSA